MSEHPFVEHGVKSYKIWRDPRRSFLQKLRDIFIEMLIIIFAVLITIYFERFREHQQEVKIKTEFLTGYKNDLLKDLKELAGDTSGYHRMQNALIQLIDTKNLSKGRIDTCMNAVGQSIEFTPNDSRFEALKAAGKLSAIDNAELLTAMFNLYQKDIPYLKSFGTGSFNAYRQQQIQPFYDQVSKYDEHGHIANLAEIVKMNTMRNYFMYSLGKTYEIKNRYRAVITGYKKILALIDEEERKHQ